MQIADLLVALGIEIAYMSLMNHYIRSISFTFFIGFSFAMALGQSAYAINSLDRVRSHYGFSQEVSAARIGGWIRLNREQRLLDLGGLSTELGISMGQLSRLERGDRNPNIEILQRLEGCFGVKLKEKDLPPSSSPRSVERVHKSTAVAIRQWEFQKFLREKNLPVDTDALEIGLWLKFLRLEKNFTQKKLVQKLNKQSGIGIDQSRLSQLEIGTLQVSVKRYREFISAIEKYFNTTLSVQSINEIRQTFSASKSASAVTGSGGSGLSDAGGRDSEVFYSTPDFLHRFWIKVDDSGRSLVSELEILKYWLGDRWALRVSDADGGALQDLLVSEKIERIETEIPAAGACEISVGRLGISGSFEPYATHRIR